MAEYRNERMFVRLYVSVFVCLRVYLRNYTSDLRQVSLCMLAMALAPSCYGGVAIRYVLPVLWNR